MSTNVVVFQTERIVPHMGVPDRRASPRWFNPATELDAAQADSIEEIDRRPGMSDRLADRLAAARDRWSQLTFYLLDPASWR